MNAVPVDDRSPEEREYDEWAWRTSARTIRRSLNRRRKPPVTLCSTCGGYGCGDWDARRRIYPTCTTCAGTGRREPSR